MRPPAWWRRWWVAATAFVVIAGGVAGAVVATRPTGPSAAQIRAQRAVAAAAEAAAHQAAIQTADAQLTSSIAVSPAAGSTGVAPDSPVTVAVTSGTLTSVKVTTTGGAVLAGAMQPGSTRWVSTASLKTSTTYTVTAIATGAPGVTASRSTTFSTLTPSALVTAQVYPTDGMTVGVGQPIVVTFDHYISGAANQKAVESLFSVAMSDPVPGGWYWFSEDELHFRPESYWPAHEQIKVTADLGGWDAGSGRWGAGAVTDTFSIGDARISYANLSTDRMVVTLNGATVASYPISGGSNVYPTMNGDHIVLDRESTVHMVSSTVGIPVHSPSGYDEYVYDDVHISDSGEYVHAAPWSVYAQGSTNVSHGCINVAPANALQFFNFSRVGDVVEVTGSPRPPATGDHGVMDWATPWSSFSPATVLTLNSDGSTAPTTTSTTSTTVPVTTTTVPVVPTTAATTGPTTTVKLQP